MQQPLSIGTSVSLYADDMLLYHIISCLDDYTKLQEDIDVVSSLVDVSEFALCSSKCKYYMATSRLKTRLNGASSNSVIACIWQTNGWSHQLQGYLGVVISDGLTWSLHIDKISCKARKLVYRRFWSNSQALIKLYL